MLSRKTSIASIIIVTLVTVMTLSLCTFGYMSYKLERDRQWTALHSNLSIEADQLALSLALPVWNIDRALIDKIIESRMKNRTVYGVVVYAAGEIQGRSRNEAWDVVVVDKEIAGENLLTEERDIVFSSRSIGKVNVSVTSRFVEEELKKTLLSTIVNILFLGGVLTLGLYILLWRIVINPLKEIERYALSVSSESVNIDTVWSTVFKGELENVRGAIARMVSLLREHYGELEKSEEKFSTAFHSSPGALGITRLSDNVVIEVNSAFEKLSGYTRDEIVGHTTIELGFWADLVDRERLIKLLSDKGAAPGQEYDFRAKNGVLRRCRISSERINLRGEECALTTLVDLTEQKHAEEIIKHSEERFRQVVEASNDGIWEWDIATNVVSWSDRVFEMFMMPKGSFDDTFESVSGLVHPEDRQLFDDALKGHLEEDLPYNIELRFLRGDNSYGYYLCRGKSIRDAAMKPVRMIGSIEDITERKRAEQALRESEAHHRALFENSPDIIAVFDRSGRYLLINSAVSNVSILKPSEFVGKFMWEVGFTKEQAAFREEAIRQVFDTKVPFESEFEFAGVHGKSILEWRLYPVIDQTGNVLSVFSINRDITKRKRAEEELKRSEDRLRATVNNTPYVAVQWYDEEGRVTFWNHASERIFGWKAEETMGKTLDHSIHTPEGAAEFLEVLRTIKRTGKPVGPVEYEFKRRDGSIGVCLSTTFEIPSSEGKSSFVCMDVDVTERKHAEVQNALFAQTLRSTQDCISITDLNNNILFANDAFLSLYGYTESELIGKHISVIVSPTVSSEASQVIVSKTAEGGWHGEIINRHKNGREFPVELWTSLVKDQSGATVAMVGVARDITERRRAQEQIVQQAKLLDVAKDAIIVRDMNDGLVYMNRAAELLYGWTVEETRSMRPQDFIADADWEKFQKDKQTFMARGEWEGELRQKTKRGKELVVQTRWTMVRDAKGTPTARLIINRDVTEQHKLEAQFRRAQRLESLGTLAGGIAHDLNNVLAPIMMSTALLDKKVTDPDLKRWITALETSTQRGREIIKQVLMFARGSERDFAPQQLRYVVREITTMIHQTFPKSIELKTSVPSDLESVMGDATQLHQVLMNLCVNARDAMPEGGRLVIAVSNVTLDDKDTEMQVGGIPGQYVVMSISDTGSGIPKDIQEKIFEPFFTTKELGKGTGLGLSTVYAIVKDHNGFITLSSEIGKGTEFKIYLPAIRHEEEPETAHLAKILPSGQGQLILIVDDEQSVLQICKETLEMYGYRVLTAENGIEAVAFFQSVGTGQIHLVITDVNMPKMDGPTAVRAIRKLDHNIKVIIASGLLTDLDQLRLKDLDFQGYLTKPFTSERMLTMIHEVLAKEMAGFN